jgi:uncharacterized membrane protein
MESNKFRPILLSVALLLGFSTLIMFVLTHLAQRYSLMYNCGCAFTLPITIILLSGTGIVVGVLTYYFLSGSFERRRKIFNKNKSFLLNFLDDDERLVIEKLLKQNGEMSQSNLSKSVNLDRVKVFRILERLEQKKVIIKQKNKKTNKILLVDELKELLL